MTERAFVYFITNGNNGVLYIGVTNDLGRRIGEHRQHHGSGFTLKYKLCKLVYFEVFDSIDAAIAREKQLKAGPRRKKNALVNQFNPSWQELAPPPV